MTDPLNILIIDDHRLVADGLSMILSKLVPGSKVSTAHNVRSVLENDALLNVQNLILVDLHMPTIDGFGFLKALAERNIKVPVIVVSAVENRSDIKRVIDLGAKGFIPKNAPSAEMLNGAKAVLAGEIFVPEHLTGTLNWSEQIETSPIEDVSSDLSQQSINLEAVRERQIEVLNLMHAGYSNIDIATVLDVSESTVKAHVSTLFKALNVKNRTACVRAGLAHKLIQNIA